MSKTRDRALAVSYEGNIYNVGGSSNSSVIQYEDMNEMYNPITNTWVLKAPMPTKRCMIGGAILNDELYVVGGANETNYLSTVEKYNFKTNTWSTVASMNISRREPAVSAINGKLYVIGGVTEGVKNSLRKIT